MGLAKPDIDSFHRTGDANGAVQAWEAETAEVLVGSARGGKVGPFWFGKAGRRGIAKRLGNNSLWCQRHENPLTLEESG